MYHSKIIIHEVSMRDGLQMEKQIISTDTKLQWIHDIAKSGVDIIQVGSFVHPVKVPQMADTDKLFQELKAIQFKKLYPNVILSALILNDKGLERGLNSEYVDMFCMGVSASETHSQKNTGMSTKEATEKIINIALNAKSAGKKVQVSVQSAFGCGYEGTIDSNKVLDLVKRFLDADLKNISLADTNGYADPETVFTMFKKILSLDSAIECTCHFHNTYGLGIVNAYAAIKAGVKYFEASCGGLGGCPFAKIAGGNLCTEDFVLMLQKCRIRTDIKLDVLIELANKISQYLQKDLPGIIYKTDKIPL